MTTIKEGDELARDIRHIATEWLPNDARGLAEYFRRASGWRDERHRCCVNPARLEAASKLLRSQHNGATQGDKVLREALEPFVPAYDDWMDEHADDVKLGFHRSGLTFGDLRRARAALSTSSPSGGMAG